MTHYTGFFQGHRVELQADSAEEATKLTIGWFEVGKKDIWEVFVLINKENGKKDYPNEPR